MGFPTEILFIFVLAFLLFGPRQLPQLATRMGRFMAELKKARESVENTIQDEIQKLDLEEANPTKHLSSTLKEANKFTGQADDSSLTGALQRFADQLTNSSPQK